MRGRIRSYDQAARNAQDGSSLAETAEHALESASEMLSRMRELSVRAGNDTLAVTDRVALESEFQSLVEEVDRVANETQFNGTSLLDGSATNVAIQVGAEDGDVYSVPLANIQSTTLEIDSLDVMSSTNASNALETLDSAITSVNAARGSFGAARNALDGQQTSLRNSSTMLSAAESRLRDADYAQGSADLTRQLILQQSKAAVQVQLNSDSSQASDLL